MCAQDCQMLQTEEHSGDPAEVGMSVADVCCVPCKGFNMRHLLKRLVPKVVHWEHE